MPPATLDTVRAGSGAMFDAIAERYDLLNRVLSLGIDRGWRRRAVQALALGAADRVLDLACGTGDVAVELLRRHPGAQVLGLDPSAGMLAIAGHKLAGQRFAAVRADGERLPLPDRCCAAAIIAFGIRNVPDRDAALRELARVVRPNGRVVVLELGEPRGASALLYRSYFRHLVPALGALLSRGQAYRYLRSSVQAFPPPDAFASQLQAAGLQLTAVERLTLGAAHLFVATVP